MIAPLPFPWSHPLPHLAIERAVITSAGRLAGRREDAERGGPSPATQLMPPASRLGLTDSLHGHLQ
jgi:hypothetical protein